MAVYTFEALTSGVEAQAPGREGGGGGGAGSGEGAGGGLAVRGAARAAAARVGRTGHTRRIAATCTWWPRSCLVGFRVGVKVRVGLGLG